MKRAESETARLLGTQYGVVTRRQLLRAGMTPRQIGWRRETGEWVPMHRGVYRSIAFPCVFEQRLMAAVLVAGSGAVASHSSAAWLWGLLARPPDRPSVAVPAKRRPRVAGVDLFHPNDLDASRSSYWRNFPCTNPLRTLVDLAGVARGQDLVEALDRALSTGLVTVGGLESEIVRRATRGRPGVQVLRTVLAERFMTGAPTPSALEAETLRLFARFKIPVLGREVRAGADGRYRLDISLVPPVAVEVDGFAFHSSPEAKNYDEKRRNQLRLRGIFLLVYTWYDIRFNPERVVREVLAALSSRAGVDPRDGYRELLGVTSQPPRLAPR